MISKKMEGTGFFDIMLQASLIAKCPWEVYMCYVWSSQDQGCEYHSISDVDGSSVIAETLELVFFSGFVTIK